MNLSKEQHESREIISLYEGGSTLTCEMAGKNLWIESETGKTWLVYPEGRIVREPQGEDWHTDLVELMARVESPQDFTQDDFDPGADDLMGLAPVSDFHSDRWAELQEQSRVDREDELQRRRQEAA